jgi:uroporphyrinogen decarboxylase
MEPTIGDFQQRLAVVDDDVIDVLGLDVKGINPRSPATYKRIVSDDGEYLSYLDEWGVTRRMPKDGFFFDPVSAPLAGDISEADVDRFPWPDPSDPARYEGLVEEARRIAEEGRAVYVASICSGLTEVFFKIRGFEDGYMDLVANPGLARRIMERILEIKLQYWEHVLPALGDAIDVAGESDDLGGQQGLLFSPTTYRELVRPLHAELFSAIHKRSEAKVFLHCCGAIRELIPDLIDVGVDVLNPVQVSAVGMESGALKRDFGRDLVFWGGGVDTQRVLASGTAEQVREDVSRHVIDLKRGGGFVFAAVHNIQANVSPENVFAMWAAFREHASYGGELELSDMPRR